MSEFYGPWVDTPESSNVLRFAYALAKLRVAFQNGSEYEYFVPPYYYKAMKMAPSKGKFVFNYLRKANKPYRLVRGPFKKPLGEVRREVPYKTEPGRPRRKLGEKVMRGPYKEKELEWEGGDLW
ncbi:hypothetical protein LCGC14_0697140 [marine sediment metagenome]|uniref:KTSC domain-containing protein n=1 Tax=marine sediment metagenome TaxID=412755 RepID=A0A0F9QNK7_9ZZZZ